MRNPCYLVACGYIILGANSVVSKHFRSSTKIAAFQDTIHNFISSYPNSLGFEYRSFNV
jgi:hypothetical protein